MRQRTRRNLTSRLITFLICFVFALGTGLTFGSLKANALGTFDPLGDDNGINPRKAATQNDLNKSVSAATAFNAEVAKESLVLMKNDGTLPLAKGTEVSLFGKNSHHIVYGGSGSSSTSNKFGQTWLSHFARDNSSSNAIVNPQNEVKFTNADGGELTKAGIKVNKELSDYYSTFARSGATKNNMVGANDPALDYSTREPALVDFLKDDKAVASYASEYNKVAIMTISRLGGEGSDMPRQLTTTGQSLTDATNGLAGSVQTLDAGGAAKRYSSSAWAEDDKYHHALEPENQEIDMVKYIKTPKAQGGAGFEKLILLVNTGTPMELDSLTQYADAVMWIGFPGASGLTAVAQALVGDVNPSGRFVDTWARDLIKTPAVQDFGSNLRINVERNGLYGGYNTEVDARVPNAGSRYGAPAANGQNNSGQVGVRYQEDIYVGYRYYETRGFTERQAVLTADPSATAEQQYKWYNDEVAYPFGSGMSYSSGFSWEFQGANPTEGSTIAKGSTLTFNVRVTNATAANGGVAGKDVVQLYYSAPYYKNGIEKSHVVLGGFAKTGIIQPGGHEDVTISMKVNDLASYDWSDANGNDFKGYEVEAGDYKFYLAKDAHAAWANPGTLTRTLSVASTGSTGDFSKTATSGKGINGFAVKVSEATGNPIVNQFDDVSLGWFGGPYAAPADRNATAWQGFQRMSRSDFAGTFPKTPMKTDHQHVTHTVSGQVGITVNGAYDTNNAGATVKPWIVTAEPSGNNGDTVNNPNTQQDIILADLIGVDKYDEKWENFLDQFSFRQLWSVLQGFYMAGGTNGAYSATNNMPNFGLMPNWSPDGPTGHASGSGFAPGANSCVYLSPIGVASTWNVELVEKLGVSFGNEALVLGVTAIYAPAMDTHRTPFSGRNFEYYSEDGFLAGKIAAAQVKGMQSKGLIVNIKHFFVNDQDTDRDTIGGLYTWVSEQAIREIYLKAFQIPVEEGGALGVMSAFNRVGAVPCSDSYPLLTEVLRNEWGFEGYVVTDWYGSGSAATGKSWTNMFAGFRAGNDMILGSWSNVNSGDPAADQATPDAAKGYRNTHIAAVRKSAHNILFALSRSNAIFRSYAGLQQTGARTGGIDVSSTRALYWNNAIHTTGITISYRLTPITGNVLPAGFSLDPSTGFIISTNGTAVVTAVDNFDISIDTMVTTTGLVGTWRMATMEYEILLDEVDISYQGMVFKGIVGQPFSGSFNLASSKHDNTIAYTIVDGTLPAGLYVDRSGVIFGTPTTAGNSDVKVKAYFKDNPTGATVSEMEVVFTFNIAAASTANNWFSGTGVPAATLGVDGDYYLRTSDNNVYRKANNEWAIINNFNTLTENDVKTFIATATAGLLDEAQVNDLIDLAVEDFQTAAQVITAINTAMEANTKGFLTNATATDLINQLIEGKLNAAQVQAIIDASIAEHEKDTAHGGCGSSTAAVAAIFSLLTLAFIVVVKKQF